MTVEEILEEGFEKAEARMASLRITANELFETTDKMVYTTYWRARKGVTSTKAQVKVLRFTEQLLDEMERTNNERAV